MTSKVAFPMQYQNGAIITSASNRYQIVAKILTKDIPGFGSLLDVGCRDCVLKSYLGPDVAYKGVDLSPPQGVPDVDEGNLEAGLPYGDGDFDVVAALDVLEHCDDIFFAFKELHRVSRRYIVINLPNEYHVAHRARFLLGRLPGKFRLDPQGYRDRHRWMFNWENLLNFIQHIRVNYAVHITTYAVSKRPRRFLLRLALLPFARSKTLGAWSYVLLIEKQGVSSSTEPSPS